MPKIRTLLFAGLLIASPCLSAENVSSLYRRAREQLKQEHYEKAFDLFKKCAESDPQNSAYWKYAGIALDNLKKYDEAPEYYEKAKELAPDDHDIRRRLGFLYHIRLNDNNSALQHYVEAIRLMEDKKIKVPAWLYYNTGLTCCHSNDRDWKNAETYFRKAIRKAEENEEKYKQLANSFLMTALREQGKYGELFDYANRNPGDSTAYKMFSVENIGNTLYKAVGRDDLDFARFLLEKGAPVNHVHGDHKNTCLHVAVYRDNPQMVKLLLAYDPDIFLLDSHGNTPYLTARYTGKKACMEQFNKQDYQEYYQGYLVAFPLGGHDGIDYFSASGFDNNPEPSLPLAIPGAVADRIINSRIPEDKRALFKKYYAPIGETYRLIDLEKQVQMETVWVARILTDWGAVADSIFREDVTLDYMGNTRTYDNHIGHDFCLLSYEFQDYGVPVYAAANGHVVTARKGFADREVKPGEERGENTVTIDHGYDRTTYYNHLRKDVLVDVGDYVHAGQQIAWVGAAGVPTSGKAQAAGATPSPHLHFSVIEWGEWLEPYEGPAHTEPSRWREQPPYKQALKLLDFGISNKNEVARYPLSAPGRSCYRLNEKDIEMWFHYYFLEPGIPLTYKIRSPEGRDVYSDRVLLQDEYWNKYAIDLNTIPLYEGTWTAQIYRDTTRWFQCTFDVIGEGDVPPKNRAPETPVNPGLVCIDADTHDIYKCSVDFPSVYIDPDLDRMRYRYVWKLDGRLMRDVTMASHFDYFPTYMAEKGAEIECNVYAYDGQDYSKPVVLKDSVMR